MPDLPPAKIIRSHRKSMAMSIAPDATLVVKVPFYMPKFAIDNFIKEHAGWIKERLEKSRQRYGLRGNKYTDGAMVTYLGQEYRLDIGNYPSIALQDNRLLFPAFLEFRIQKELTDWYIKQAREVITRLVTSYAAQMKTSYTGLAFTDTSSQWGSCSRDNRLQFCWRLIMAPLLVITYVVTHELAHTMEKNHSSSFWSRVRLFNPSYRQQRKWLQEHGHMLVL